MRKIILFTALFSIPIMALWAQKTGKYISATTWVEQGIALYDKGSYDDAITAFNQVNPNDPLYPWALYEKIMAYNAMDSINLSLQTVDTLMNFEQKLDEGYYNLIGVTFSNAKKLDEAEAFFAKVYDDYKYHPLFIYNYGVVEYRKGNLDLAEKLFAEAIRVNPYHYRSHLLLGYVNYAKGRLIPALMCLSFASNVAPNNEQAYNAALSFENAVNEKLGETIMADSKGNIATSSSTDEINQAFTELEFLVKSNFVGNKKFKAKSDIDYNFIKQIQLIFENIKPRAGATDIYNQLYIPYYNQIMERKYFENYAYHISGFINNEKVQKKVKKNASKVQEYGTWGRNYLEQGRAKLFNPAEPQYYTFNGANVEGIGQYTDPVKKEKTGMWIYYYPGNSKASEGPYQNNKRNGKWTFYHKNRNVSSIENYLYDSIDGSYISYHDNGVMSEISHFKNGRHIDTAYSYNTSGNLEKMGVFDDSGKIRLQIMYFNNGNIKELTEYKNGLTDGRYEEYYPNGQPSLKSIFSQNVPEGKVTIYFPNGQTEKILNFNKGLTVGEQKIYYSNGKPMTMYTTNDKGENIGLYLRYYRNGILADSTFYNEKGEENGIAYYFNTNGILNYTIDYKKAKPQSYVQYNTKGEKITEGKRIKDTLAFRLLYPHGATQLIGTYRTVKRDGLWMQYNRLGTLIKKAYYKNGLLDGEFYDYFNGGQIYEKISYTEGEQDGYETSYFKSGQIAYDGFVNNGKYVGLWNSYYPNGNPHTQTYYVDGKMQGKVKTYTCEGKKDYEEIYENDCVIRRINYDENEKFKNSCELKNGNGTLEFKHPNGKIASYVKVLGGKFYDTLRVYNVNGTLIYQVPYIEGQKHGNSVAFDDKGEKELEQNYILGKENGTSKIYEEGKLVREEEYDLGVQLKETEYYSNSKIKKISYLSEDNYLIDTCFIFAEDGNLAYAILYDGSGIAVSYLYTDKTSKYVEILIAEKNMQIRTFFSNGNPSFEVNYVNGWMEGMAKTWHPNGTLAVECNYARNDLNGENKIYSAKGVLLQQSFYQNGILNGIIKKYSDIGILQEEKEYMEDRLHGICKYYNTKGNLKSTCQYYNGDLMSETIAK